MPRNARRTQQVPVSMLSQNFTMQNTSSIWTINHRINQLNAQPNRQPTDEPISRSPSRSINQIDLLTAYTPTMHSPLPLAKAYIFFFNPPADWVKIKLKLTTLPRSNFVSCVYLTSSSCCNISTGCCCYLRLGTLTRPDPREGQVRWR